MKEDKNKPNLYKVWKKGRETMLGCRFIESHRKLRWTLKVIITDS